MSRFWRFIDPVLGHEPTPRDLGIVTKTPKLCSCDLCCNRRKLEGPTRQELMVYDSRHYSTVDNVASRHGSVGFERNIVFWDGDSTDDEEE